MSKSFGAITLICVIGLSLTAYSSAFAQEKKYKQSCSERCAKIRQTSVYRNSCPTECVAKCTLNRAQK